jgi:hypothetical protein
MAEYRQIHTRIWKDGWFIDLTADEKLLFIYLFSNERASVAGIYELPLKIMVFESGLERKVVEAALAKFGKAGKVHYEAGVVWVVNLRKYNENKSPKVSARLSKDLAAIPDCPIKRRYLEYYNPIEAEEYSMDTVSVPVPQSVSEQEQEQEQETERRGASAPPPPPSPRKPRKEYPPAVQAFISAAHYTPDSALHQSMQEAIGDKPADLKFWGDVVLGWIAKGWNPRNISGMFDFYKRRELPANGKPVSANSPLEELRRLGYLDANGNPV